jgi:hypothetical protein
VLLDLVGNMARLGLPDEEREWSLEGRKKKDKGEVDNMICPKCNAAQAPARLCVECGHECLAPEAEKETKGGGRMLGEVDGELEEVNVDQIRQQREQLRRKQAREQGRVRSLDDLIMLGTARGFKSPEKWAAHVITARARAGR